MATVTWPGLERYHRLRALMHQLFPDVFTARGTPPVALKVGVFDDLETATGVSRDELRAFLRGWTGRHEYLAVIAAGGPRYDLNGHPVGEVTPEQQAYAAERLASMQIRPSRYPVDPEQEAALAAQVRRRPQRVGVGRRRAARALSLAAGPTGP